VRLGLVYRIPRVGRLGPLTEVRRLFTGLDVLGGLVVLRLRCFVLDHA